MTLESLLAEQGPMTAQELSQALQKPIEDVYERLVSLEGKGIAVLTYVPGSQKYRNQIQQGRPEYRWVMA
jgi:predicted ArsR family transcriptional regulator